MYCYRMITLVLMQHVGQVNKLRFCFRSVFHILHIHLTSHYVIRPLNEAIGEKKFSTDVGIKEVMHGWLRYQSDVSLSQNPGIGEQVGR